MLLLIDVGNTNTVFALYAGRDALGQWRLSTNRERTAEEYAATLIQLMALDGHHRRDVEAVLIASVVPQAVLPLRWMSRDFFGCVAFVVGEDVDVPIQNRLHNPKEAGADRLVNALAAVVRYGPPLIVVDFGTATTFDIVDKEGAFIGGVIAPGVNLSLEALHHHAAKLPRIAVSAPGSVIGKGTVHAMQSGVYYGYIGLVDGLVERIQAEYGQVMRVIATGGLAKLFVRGCRSIAQVDPDLTMAGLMEIFERDPARIRAGRLQGRTM